MFDNNNNNLTSIIFYGPLSFNLCLHSLFNDRKMNNKKGCLSKTI